MDDPRMQEAIAQMQSLITERFPGTTFAVGEGDDPCGVHMTAVVDVDDIDDVVDHIIDQLVKVQIDDGLPLYVTPIETPARRDALRARLAAGVE